jgi:hypothetical protein
MYKVCENQKKNKKINDNVTEITKSILSTTNGNNFITRTFEYIKLFNNEFYPSMKVNIKERELIYKIDILVELIDYLKSKDFDNKRNIIKQLIKINRSFLKTRELDYNQKDFIIRNIENNPITTTFLEYIKEKYKILPELEMMYERYSSILHLILISRLITKSFEISFSYISPTIELNNDNKIVIYTADKLINPKSKWLKQMIMRYCYFNYILKTEKTPKVLSMFLVNFPKMLYNSGMVGPAEINTGMTNGIYINITRKEEALKTLLHELIHFHNMDFREIPNSINNYLIKRFGNVSDEGYNMKLNLFEAYTECIASILNILLFYNYNISITDKKNYELYINNLINRLTEQIVYTYGKCYKLKKYFKCDKLENCKINQKTNTVSYFFIKSYLYFYLSTFIKCIDIETAKFIECDTSFNHLEKLIKLGYNNTDLQLLYKSCYSDNKLTSKFIKKDISKENTKQHKKSIKMVCIVENIF